MMTVRRPGISLLGALLAFAAILGVFALSSWHSAVVDDSDPVHAVSIGRIDSSHEKTDPDGVIHVVAHATASIVWIASTPLTAEVALPVGHLWWRLVTLFLASSDPSGLLRPPQD